MLMVGFRLLMGFWKIIAIFAPRMLRMETSLSPISSVPSSSTDPASTRPRLGSSPMMARAVEVFPAPVSPMMPRVSRFSSAILTPWTA